MTLLENVQTMLKMYGLRDYIPPNKLALANLEMRWLEVLGREKESSGRLMPRLDCELDISFYNVRSSFLLIVDFCLFKD